MLMNGQINVASKKSVTMTRVASEKGYEVEVEKLGMFAEDYFFIKTIDLFLV